MNERATYKDPITGYEITRYTNGPMRNAKLYFTTENYTPDDKYFFFNRENDGLYICEARTGAFEKLADAKEYSGFATDRQKPYGVICKDGDTVCKVSLPDGKITQMGRLPKGGHVTGHLTTADTGRVACSYQLESKIYALVVLDPGKEDAEIVYMSDYHLGHSQICPTDENQIFYIHETGGDALQRTWMYDVNARAARPYYVEAPNEWITHEVWSADGAEMALMKLPGRILIGDKDGRHFDQVAQSEQLLHPCISRDKKWLCADRISYFGVPTQHAIVLIERETGEAITVATTHAPKTGADHQHPSFNRAGDTILFSNPDENGVAQVCAIDLRQIKKR